MTKFAERLKEKRLEMRLTQSQLADMCGLGVATIWNYENENFTPTLYGAVAIAEKLNVSLDWLAGRVD